MGSSQFVSVVIILDPINAGTNLCFSFLPILIALSTVHSFPVRAGDHETPSLLNSAQESNVIRL